MTDRLNNAFESAVDRVRDRKRKYGLLGKHEESTVVFVVPGRANYLFVTVRNANGAQTAVPARNDAGVPQSADLPVEMRVENGTTWVIVGRTAREDMATVPASPPSGVPIHVHNLADLNDVTITAAASGDVLAHNGTDWVDATNIPVAVAATIVAATAKTTPVDADTMPLIDSAASNVLKKVTWANIKATLKTYFDTLYEALGAVATHAALTVTHGATGAIVGTTNTQTLTNKTLTTPTIVDFTNAQHDHGDADDGGAIVLDAELAAIAGLTSAADKGIHFTGVGTAATHDLTAFGRSLIAAAAASNARTTLELVIGTNVQAFDAELAAIAGLTSAADRLAYFTGSGTAALATFTAFARTLMDDADAATARTTLSLGTMAVEAAANYLLASGATPLTGEWDIGEDMSIRAERLEARDIEGLRIEDDGGNIAIHVADGGKVLIGTSGTPGYDLEIRKAIADFGSVSTGTGTGDYARFFAQGDTLNFVQVATFGSGYTGSAFGQVLAKWSLVHQAGAAGSGMIIGTGANFPIIFGQNNIERMRLTAAGLGIGTTAPQGRMHIDDGTGSSMFVSKSAVAGTKVVIIADGTGDVTSVITGMYTLSNSDGTEIGGIFTIINPGTFVATIGGTTWTFTVAANGEFSVIRTSGTDTATIVMQLVWR